MTPTIKQLIERATPGPWKQFPIRGGDKWIEIPLPAVRVDYDDVNHDEQEANAQLIARCSPEVMARVVEALEDASTLSDETGSKSIDLKARAALNLLNGKTP